LNSPIRNGGGIFKGFYMTTVSKNLEGFVELDPNEVISICEKKLLLINEARQKYKDKCLKEYLESNNFECKFLRWFGFKKATMEDALINYKTRVQIPFSLHFCWSNEDHCNRLYQIEENLCNVLIANAQLLKTKINISLKDLYRINPLHMNEIIS
jgi:mannosyltransferase OCH1-like enzyme